MAVVSASTKRVVTDTKIIDVFNDIVQEMLDAKGAYNTLKARVDALTAAPSSEWVESGQTPTFVSSTQFTIPTDLTTKFEANRRVQAELTAGTLVYSHVTSSSFAASLTTVNIADAVLTSALSKVWYSFWGAGSDRAWPADILQVGEIKRISPGSFLLDATNAPVNALAGYTPVLDFDPATAQYIYAVFPIPTDFDVIKTSKLRIGCTMSTSAAGNVVFAGDRVAAKDGEAVTGVGTAFTATITPNATAGLRSTHDIVTFAANTFEQADTVTLRLFRDAANAADTHGGLFRLITVEIEYTTRRGAAI